MRPSLSLVLTLGMAAFLTACGRNAEPPQPVAPPAPQTSGTLAVPGLKGEVTVVRDEWGVPHITAATLDDLFFAQGFVQAQDRLFQMDLWKRAAQGRLAEVLGANFIQRDSMTRRIQFRGDYEREWASYGPDARKIAVAFTDGINAWVTIARNDVPEAFAVAGWLPEFWKPEDLLNRTDAFLASGNALDDIFRARMVAALGAQKVDELLPLPRRQRTVTDFGVDLSSVTFVVADALRRLGTPPFFTTLTNPVSDAPRPGRTTVAADVPLKPGDDSATSSPRNRQLRVHPGRIASGTAWAVGPSNSLTGGPLLVAAEFNRLEAPARRYLVHLTAPGINVIGATAPWLPGVITGHNERIAWSFTPNDEDTQDIFVEQVNPENPHQVARDGRWVDMAVDIERVSVLGRDKPVEYERLYTPNGVVIAQDREQHLVYTLRWAGTEPGGAGELAALSLMRAGSWEEFRAALSMWKAPAGDFLYADVDGRIARQPAGLIPVRLDGRGALPAAGWISSRGWQGFRDASTAPADMGTMDGYVVSSGVPEPQRSELRRVLEKKGQSPETNQEVMRNVSSRTAATLVAQLRRIDDVPQDLADARQRLLSWDYEVQGSSPAAALYVAWEGAIRQRLAARIVKSELVDEFAARLDPVSTLEGPVSRGAGGDIGPWRDVLLVSALSDAIAQLGEPDRADGEPLPGIFATLAHPLGVFAIGQKRFNVGPYPLNGHSDTILATDGRRAALFRAIFDVADWNRSLVVNAPGQSGSPSSRNYDDQATPWSVGTLLNLVFDLSTLARDRASTLTIRPAL